MSEATAEGGQSSIEDSRVASGRLRKSIRLGSGGLPGARRPVLILPRGRLGEAEFAFLRLAEQMHVNEWAAAETAGPARRGP
jgi:hypothetical protein